MKLFLCCLVASVLMSGCATSRYAMIEGMSTEPNRQLQNEQQFLYDFNALDLHPDYLMTNRSVNPVMDDLYDLW